MHKLYNEIMYFVGVKEEDSMSRFLFTNAALEILRKNYVLLDEEVSFGLRNRLMNNFEDFDISSNKSIESMIREVEEQILCEQFLSQNFPRIHINSHSLITYNGQSQIETTVSFTKPKIKELVKMSEMRSSI